MIVVALSIYTYDVEATYTDRELLDLLDYDFLLVLSFLEYSHENLVIELSIYFRPCYTLFHVTLLNVRDGH